jgi:hypothetical protein
MRIAVLVVVAVLIAGCGGEDDDAAPPTTTGDPELMAMLPTASDLGVDYSEVPLTAEKGSSDPGCNGFAAVTSPIRRASRAFVQNGEPEAVIVSLFEAEDGKGASVFEELTSVFEPGADCEEQGAEMLVSDIRVIPPLPDGQEGRAVRLQGARGTDLEGGSALTRVFLVDDLILSITAIGENNQVSARIDSAVDVAVEALDRSSVP